MGRSIDCTHNVTAIIHILHTACGKNKQGVQMIVIIAEVKNKNDEAPHTQALTVFPPPSPFPALTRLTAFQLIVVSEGL